MSADLSKSKLASKDKDELTQIAQAMGGKPPSRARKADLIDLIMELAQGGPSESAPAASTPAYSADPMADVRAAEGKVDAPKPRRRREAEPAPETEAATAEADAEPADQDANDNGSSNPGQHASPRDIVSSTGHILLLLKGLHHLLGTRGTFGWILFQ